MDGAANVRVGMRAYSSDGQEVGTVEGATDDSVTIRGRQIPAAMVTAAAGDTVTLNYTAAQFAWQGAPGNEKDDAVSYDPSGKGDLANMAEWRERRAEERRG